MIVLFKHKWNRRMVRAATVYTLLTTLLTLITLATTIHLVSFLWIIVLLSYIPLTGLLLILQFINVLKNTKDILEHTMTLILVLLNYPIGFLHIYLLNP